jgi:hypothetical protein
MLSSKRKVSSNGRICQVILDQTLETRIESLESQVKMLTLMLMITMFKQSNPTNKKQSTNHECDYIS